MLRLKTTFKILKFIWISSCFTISISWVLRLDHWFLSAICLTICLLKNSWFQLQGMEGYQLYITKVKRWFKLYLSNYIILSSFLEYKTNYKVNKKIFFNNRNEQKLCCKRNILIFSRSCFNQIFLGLENVKCWFQIAIFFKES